MKKNENESTTFSDLKDHKLQEDILNFELRNFNRILKLIYERKPNSSFILLMKGSIKNSSR
jgi:signal-transduction protein with cAMP-binding, CBS, and nucleotidyltransferase domain